MSFITEIEKQSSKKFSLVRLSPKEVLDVASIGSDLYQVTTQRNVFECYIGTTKLTSAEYPPSVGEYNFNESTGALTVYSDTLIATIIIGHNIYLCSDKNRAIGKDPSSPSVNVVEWQGRILREPSFSQSVENLSFGIMTSSSSSIDILNDGFLDFIFNDNSFILNCKFDCWFFCDDVSNINYAFSGYMTTASQSGLNVSIQTSDALQLLKKECFCGDTTRESFFTTDEYASGDPSKYGQPIPFIFWPCSHSKVNNDGIFPFINLQSDSLREAFCNSYNETISVTANRLWTCCRVIDEVTFSASVSFTVNVLEYTVTLPSSDDGKKFIVGDRCALGGTYGFIVKSVSGATLVLDGPVSLASPQQLLLESIPYVDIILEDETPVHITPDAYTVFNQAADGENIILSILFAPDFEASYLAIGILDPRKHKVLYRVKPVISDSSDAVMKIIEGAGLDANFTNTVPADTTCLEIPAFGESSYESCDKYLEKIFRSCGTFIYLNDDQTINYENFNAPGSPDPTAYLEITQSDIIKGSLSISESAQDVKTKVNYFPSCAKFEYPNGITYFLDDNQTSTSNQNEESVESVIYPLTISPATWAQLSTKIVKYSFDLKTKGYGLKLGDTVKINGRYLTVISLEKSLSKIGVTAINIYNQ